MSPVRQALELPVAAYLADHHLPPGEDQGQSVLPATEALQALAEICGERVDPGLCRDAHFLRFIPTPRAPGSLSMQAQLHEQAVEVRAVLGQTVQAGQSGMQRWVDLVEARFGGSEDPPELDELDLVGLPGPGLALDAGRLYEELVPFGPAFQNLTGKVFLSGDGAFGFIQTPEHPAPLHPLGSPFALDAAFHLACAWTQHRQGVLTFPLGFERRQVLRPVASGQGLCCRIWHRGPSARGQLFDLALLDDQGQICEWVGALEMGDVFSGRIPVPEWVRTGRRRQEKLGAFFLQAGIRGILWPLDAMAPFSAALLSEEEGARLEGMGSKRRRSYLGARLSLKALARAHGVRGRPRRLQTVHEDGRRPACPGFEHVAAAHDAHFAVAVVGDGPVGVDVESKAASARRSERMWLDEEERRILQEWEAVLEEGWLRAWCAKEAAAKALDVDNLAEAFRRVRVKRMDEGGVDLLVDGRKQRAPCLALEGSMLCVLKLQTG